MVVVRTTILLTACCSFSSFSTALRASATSSCYKEEPFSMEKKAARVQKEAAEEERIFADWKEVAAEEPLFVQKESTGEQQVRLSTRKKAIRVQKEEERLSAEKKAAELEKVVVGEEEQLSAIWSRLNPNGNNHSTPSFAPHIPTATTFSTPRASSRCFYLSFPPATRRISPSATSTGYLSRIFSPLIHPSMLIYSKPF